MLSFKSAVLISLLTFTPACGATIASHPPTAVAAVADIGTRVEKSAGALLVVAVNARADGFITEPQLDQVALSVDKIGNLGLDLKAELDNYTLLKAASKDLTLARAAIIKTEGDLVSTLNDVGLSIPSGTVATIDKAISDVLLIIETASGVL